MTSVVCILLSTPCYSGFRLQRPACRLFDVATTSCYAACLLHAPASLCGECTPNYNPWSYGADN